MTDQKMEALAREIAAGWHETDPSPYVEHNTNRLAKHILSAFKRVAAESFNAGVEESLRKAVEAADSYTRLADDARTTEMMNRWLTLAEEMDKLSRQLSALKKPVTR